MAKPDQLNLYELPSWGSRGVECFEKLEQIGEGTYGQVFMAKEKATGEIVALKRIRMDNEKEGFPITAIREIKILKKLHHDNIINLKEIVTSKVPDEDEKAKQATLQDQAKQGNLHDQAKQNNTQDQAKPDDKNIYKGSIYMVFEYMDHDLTGLSDRPGMRFSIPQVKCYMKQLLTGLHYCHINQVLHRDIKGSNLLIDNNGNLKLADFGLARSFSGDQNAVLTNRVITLWYRPPELLLGSMKYGPAVDMWSVGCIFAELLQGKPILTGKNETEQISRIYNLCGSAEESSWPGVSKLPHYHKFKPQRVMKRRVAEQFKNFERHALELVEKMLTMDPSKRITAKDALDAEYFWTDPLPCSPRSLPKYEASHEYQTKKKRQQQRQQQEEMAKRQKTNQYQQPNGRAPPMQNPQGHLPMRPGPGQPHNPLPNSYPAGPPGGASRHPPGGGRMGHGGQAGYPNRGGQGGTYGGPPQQGSYAGPPMNNQGRGYGMGNMGNYPQGPYVGGGGGRGRGMAGNNRGQQFGPPNAPPMPQVPYGNQPYMQPQQYGDMDPAYPRSSHTGY